MANIVKKNVDGLTEELLFCCQAAEINRRGS